MEPRILRTNEAAQFLGLSASTLNQARLDGIGPDFIRLGRRAVGYDVHDLERWLDTRRSCHEQPTTEEVE